MKKVFNVIVEKGEDGYLVSEVLGLPGCHTQGKTHEELMTRTREAIEAYLLAKNPEVKSTFLSLEQVEVNV
ncbi:MAG: type II toxin-antitoxin system HicB family antitoxin [Candidatus Woesearchaeota archaeon]